MRTAWFFALAMLAVSTGIGSQTPKAAQDAPVWLLNLDDAAARLEVGDLKGAIPILRSALVASDGDPSALQLSGAAMLLCGRAARAKDLWQAAARNAPLDALTHYGLALSRLAQGDIDGAQSQCKEGLKIGPGNPHLTLAQRYAEQLSGVRVSGALPLPDTFRPSLLSIQAGELAARGEHQSALQSVLQSLAMLGGDEYSEPMGLSMTHEPKSPLRASFASSAQHLQVDLFPPTLPSVRAGWIRLTSPTSPEAGGYLAIRIDGKVAVVLNRPPFEFSWDSAAAANGAHEVEFITYSARGAETGRQSITVRTRNGSALAANPTTQTVYDSVRSSIWKLLTLRPNRQALATNGLRCAKALNQSQVAARMQMLLRALDPTAPAAQPSQRLASYEALWRGNADERVISLTFDDGPKPGITEHLVAALVKEQAPATFFVIGRHATNYPDLIRRISAGGMELANHSYTHPNFLKLPAREVEKELLRTQASVRDTLGIEMRYYRPPGGNTNAAIDAVAAKWGLIPCMWTVDGEKFENGRPDELIKFVLRNARPGAIILLHNGRMTTVEAVPVLVGELRKRGYRFVTVGDMAAAKRIKSAVTYRQ